MTDQPRRRGVEDPAQNEAAARRDRNDLLLVIGGAPLRQRRETRPLHFDPLPVMGVAPSNDLIDETAIGVEIVEVRRTAQQQRVLQRPLQMTMGALDGAVLMRHAGIVARWRYPVMPHEVLVALGQVLLGCLVQITVRRR